MWTERPKANSLPPRQSEPPKRRYPAEVLVFDTETLDEPGQRLMVGVWRFYRDDPDNPAAKTCIEEGLFYPDDLPERDPEGWQTLQTYVTQHRGSAAVSPGFMPELLLWPLSRWLDKRLFLYGFRHRDRCTVVGFNLLFDLAAIAAYYSAARKGAYRGGWSLAYWGRMRDNGTWEDHLEHPRILLKSIDPRRTLIGWGLPRRNDPDGKSIPGRFVDLRTLTFALTDRSYSLEGACQAFGDPFEKADVGYGTITPELLHYARADVEHTARLYRLCLDELDRHPGIGLEPHKLYSPAGVGTAYLHAMGVTPPLKKYAGQDAVAPEVLGWAMSAFFGGRAEARIVRTPLPVVVADFTSMYPAQSALLDIWPLLTAEHLDLGDVTDHVRSYIADPELVDRLYQAETWQEDIGVTLVELTDIDGAVLPVRALYEPPPAGSTAGSYNIGINPLHYAGSLWYALPDVLAATLAGPAAFTVRRAVRLRPVGTQTGLQPVQLRGGSSVDPVRMNPFVTMIEGRHEAKNNPDLTQEERDRLNLFLKITANATSYGSLARFDRRDQAHPSSVQVYGPMPDPLEAKTNHPEDPGPYCFPPIAAAITAGARLMLALIERAVADAGGSHAFMDTDSIAIVATPDGGNVPCTTATGETIHALSHAQVYGILRRFTGLNQFGEAVANDDPLLAGCPWKIEKDSTGSNVRCYAIAAKRYVLYRVADGGRELLATDEDVDAPDPEDGDAASDELEPASWSEHGLGLYLDPNGPDAPRTDGKRTWMRQAWQHVLDQALGEDPAPVEWADRYALTRFTVSNPNQLAWFATPDHGRVTGQSPRPGSFGLLAHPHPLLTSPGGAQPAAPYSPDPAQWPQLAWHNRRTGQPITVGTVDLADSAEVAAATEQGTVIVRSLGDVLDQYPLRPEHKSLAPDGTPAARAGSGKLRRRPVHGRPTQTRLIGKESNKIAERATGADNTTNVTVYGTAADEWDHEILPALRDMGARRVAAATGLTERTVRRWLNHGARPHAGTSNHYQLAAGAVREHAREASS